MTETTAAQVAAVFEFWRGLLSNSRSRLDDKRRKAIAARLKDGYSVEDLQLAVLGCRSSEWHMGGNDRNQRFCAIELICRDAEHVDRFIEIAEKAAEKEIARIAACRQKDEPVKTEQRRPMPEEARAKIDALLGRHRRG